jgi:lipopolysaccharide transport system ATP-binding protein
MIEKSGTVIIVSHSQNFMVELCDRIILMEKGEIVSIGNPSEMYKLYRKLLENGSQE